MKAYCSFTLEYFFLHLLVADPQHYLKFEIYLLNLCDRGVAVPFLS